MTAPGGLRLPLARAAESAGGRSRRHTGLAGRDLARGSRRSPLPIWTIPGIVVGAVLAALAIAHVRVELIDQGYERASAVERERQLEEQLHILTARVRELRNPARLAKLAGEMGLRRPERVITLAPPDGVRRP